MRGEDKKKDFSLTQDYVLDTSFSCVYPPRLSKVFVGFDGASNCPMAHQ